MTEPLVEAPVTLIDGPITVLIQNADYVEILKSFRRLDAVVVEVGAQMQLKRLKEREDVRQR